MSRLHSDQQLARDRGARYSLVSSSGGRTALAWAPDGPDELALLVGGRIAPLGPLGHPVAVAPEVGEKRRVYYMKVRADASTDVETWLSGNAYPVLFHSSNKYLVFLRAGTKDRFAILETPDAPGPLPSTLYVLQGHGPGLARVVAKSTIVLPELNFAWGSGPYIALTSVTKPAVPGRLLDPETLRKVGTIAPGWHAAGWSPDGSRLLLKRKGEVAVVTVKQAADPPASTITRYPGESFSSLAWERP